ncbi:dual specificity phosphatase 12 [Tyrophagus putrescentiae]|nr:dual specificity phosphatase 12 [Tyrophagus putrescentiae]
MAPSAANLIANEKTSIAQHYYSKSKGFKTSNTSMICGQHNCDSAHSALMVATESAKLTTTRFGNGGSEHRTAAATFDAQLAHIPVCIERYIYLASREAALDHLLLAEYSIATVLSLSVKPIAEAQKLKTGTVHWGRTSQTGPQTATSIITSSSQVTPIRYLYLPVENDPNEDLISHFDRLYNLFQAAVVGRRPILVHCSGASFSASSTVLAAYLMRRLGLTAAHTLLLLKARSPLILPNYGFLHQLAIYEGMGCRFSAADHRYRHFLMGHLRLLHKTPLGVESFNGSGENEGKRCKNGLEKIKNNVINLHEGVQKCHRHRQQCTLVVNSGQQLAAMARLFSKLSVSRATEEAYRRARAYHCRRCGQYLFSELHVLKGSDWARQEDLSPKNCGSLIIEPLPWMFFSSSSFSSFSSAPAQTLQNIKPMPQTSSHSVPSKRKNTIYCPRCEALIGKVHPNGGWCEQRYQNESFCSKHPTELFNKYHILKCFVVVVVVDTDQDGFGDVSALSCGGKEDLRENLQDATPATVKQFRQIETQVARFLQSTAVAN